MSLQPLSSLFPFHMSDEEILGIQDYDERADVWSVGMLMYQLLTGTFPFWDSVANISLQQVGPLAVACSCTVHFTFNAGISLS